MKPNTELNLADQNGFRHSITERNQRAYFGRIIRCLCGKGNSFESLPHLCENGTGCSPEILLSRPSDWWNQSRLEDSNILLIGCGAIGNEIAKNLVLLGVKKLTLVDFDKIEIHNLNRSICFNSYARENSQSDYKVDVMKTFLESIDPSVEVNAMRTGVLDHVSKRKTNTKYALTDCTCSYIPCRQNVVVSLKIHFCICLLTYDSSILKSCKLIKVSSKQSFQFPFLFDTLNC